MSIRCYFFIVFSLFCVLVERVMVKRESVVLMRAWYLYVKAHFKIIHLCRIAHTLIEFQI